MRAPFALVAGAALVLALCTALATADVPEVLVERVPFKPMFGTKWARGPVLHSIIMKDSSGWDGKPWPMSVHVTDRSVVGVSLNGYYDHTCVGVEPSRSPVVKVAWEVALDSRLQGGLCYAGSFHGNSMVMVVGVFRDGNSYFMRWGATGTEAHGEWEVREKQDVYGASGSFTCDSWGAVFDKNKEAFLLSFGVDPGSLWQTPLRYYHPSDPTGGGISPFELDHSFSSDPLRHSVLAPVEEPPGQYTFAVVRESTRRPIAEMQNVANGDFDGNGYPSSSVRSFYGRPFRVMTSSHISRGVFITWWGQKMDDGTAVVSGWQSNNGQGHVWTLHKATLPLAMDEEFGAATSFTYKFNPMMLSNEINIGVFFTGVPGGDHYTLWIVAYYGGEAWETSCVRVLHSEVVQGALPSAAMNYGAFSESSETCPDSQRDGCGAKGCDEGSVTVHATSAAGELQITHFTFNLGLHTDYHYCPDDSERDGGWLDSVGGRPLDMDEARAVDEEEAAEGACLSMCTCAAADADSPCGPTLCCAEMGATCWQTRDTLNFECCEAPPYAGAMQIASCSNG